MSDPVSNAEIEDVLSSIRRLVSEEPGAVRRKRGGDGKAETAEAGKLVLTPAQRVEDKTPAFMLGQENAVDETAENGNADDAPGERYDRTLQARIAELEHVINESDDGWEPDGSEPDGSDETASLDEAAPSGLFGRMTAEAESYDDEEAEDAAEDEAMASDAAVDPVEEAEPDQPEPDATVDQEAAADEQADAPDDHEAAEEARAPEEDTTATDPPDDDAAGESLLEAMTDKATDELAPEIASAVAAKIRATLRQDEAEATKASAAPEESNAAGDADPDEAPGMGRADPAPEAEPAEETAAEQAQAWVDAAGEGRDSRDATASGETSIEDLVVDEAALRQFVADVVRDELQGVLGQRITRNLRRMVRREIQRAFATRDIE